MKISIVTINWNNKEGLEKTIESVIKQTYTNIEYIIIDGASTDGSVDIIDSNKEKFAYWVSEPDKGIYNAMNKGLEKATGAYILFLNSGDYLANNLVIETIINKVKDEEDVFYGNIGVYQKGRLHEINSASKVEYFKRYQHNLPPHPAIFIKSNLLRDCGGFNESFKVISDVILIAKIFSSEKTSYKFVNMLVTIFDTDGLSSKMENQNLIYEERKRFVSQEYPQYLDDFEMIYKQSLFKKIKGALLRLKVALK